MAINKLRGRVQYTGGFAVGVGTGRLMECVTTFTAAQIKAFYSTPKTIVAAPGALKYIDVDAIIAKLTYSTAAFTGSNNLEFRYTNGSGAKVSADLGYAFLNAEATSYALVHGVVSAQTPVVNAAVVVYVPSANPGGSSAASTLTIRVLYRVVTP